MKKITLAGCIILKDNAILLLNRKKTGWYELPGGKIDENESPEYTAMRELKEELMCDVEIIRKVGTKDFEENGYTMNYVWYLARIKAGQEPEVGEKDKFNHFAFIPLAELFQHKLSPNMQNLLAEIKRNAISLNDE